MTQLPATTLSTLGERLLLIDDIRNPRIAFETVALAQAGMKVVATIHGPLGTNRLRALLRQFGVGEVFLDALIAQDQILPTHPRLVLPDAAFLKN